MIINKILLDLGGWQRLASCRHARAWASSKQPWRVVALDSTLLRSQALHYLAATKTFFSLFSLRHGGVGIV